jgi:hypothetical protein
MVEIHEKGGSMELKEMERRVECIREVLEQYDVGLLTAAEVLKAAETVTK